MKKKKLNHCHSISGRGGIGRLCVLQEGCAVIENLRLQ